MSELQRTHRRPTTKVSTFWMAFRMMLLPTLAFAGGLIDRREDISARELAEEFSWERLKGDSIYLDARDLLE